jgi:hypothetical protein
VLKRSILSCFGVIAVIVVAQTGKGLAQPAPAQQAPRPAGMPDDYKLNLMIRNAIVALNQANMTGNYSVLRDLGTPAFQVTNNPAKLAEIFGALRARKLDFSPIMFFNPKLVTPPAIQEGQLLRLTGFIPTTPEQVNFDLAFQMFEDQWMLAGIAVSTVPAAEAQRNDQVSTLAAPQMQTSRNTAEAGKPGGPGEAKPIRIDLSQPASVPSAQHKKVAKKPKPPVQQAEQAAPAPQAAEPPAASQAQPQASEAADKPTQPAQPAEPQDKGGWNPFAR